MATIQDDEISGGGLRTERQARWPRPILWWSSAGFVLLAFQVFVLVKWICGPNFTSTAAGPDVLPAWKSLVFTALQITVPVAAVTSTDIPTTAKGETPCAVTASSRGS